MFLSLTPWGPKRHFVELFGHHTIYPPLHFQCLTFSSVLLIKKEIILYFSYNLDGKAFSSPEVWKKKFKLSFRALMYIVRVSSLLLTPLQAMFERRCLGVVLLCAHCFPQCCMGDGISPISLFSSVSIYSSFSHPCQWQQTPRSCFCDSSIASNELRRIAPQEEWQPLVMFPMPPLLRSNHAHS